MRSGDSDHDEYDDVGDDGANDVMIGETYDDHTYNPRHNSSTNRHEASLVV